MPVQLLVIDIAIVVCSLLLLVRPGIDLSSPPAPLGAESHHGGWIAASALASALLLPRLSMAVPSAVCGIFMLQRLRLPLVTGGGGVRRWLSWVLWSLALLACPLAIAAVMACAHRTGTGLHAWAAHVVDVLWVAHLGVLVLAAVAVVVLTRGG